MQSTMKQLTCIPVLRVDEHASLYIDDDDDQLCVRIKNKREKNWRRVYVNFRENDEYKFVSFEILRKSMKLV